MNQNNLNLREPTNPSDPSPLEGTVRGLKGADIASDLRRPVASIQSQLSRMAARETTREQSISERVQTAQAAETESLSEERLSQSIADDKQNAQLEEIALASSLLNTSGMAEAAAAHSMAGQSTLESQRAVARQRVSAEGQLIQARATQQNRLNRQAQMAQAQAQAQKQQQQQSKAPSASGMLMTGAKHLLGPASSFALGGGLGWWMIS